MARALAGKLGYAFIDSGAMYRAVSLYFIENGIDYTQPEQVTAALDKIEIKFVFNPEKGMADTWLNGENVESRIRTMEVASVVSQVSALSPVRRFLVSQQQKMGVEKGIVMDGRDIGTVVFPDAELKIFLTARPEVRAQRRLDELKAKGTDATLEEVMQNLMERDRIDSTREDSPLKQADDSLVLDNSDITREEQLEMVLRWANEEINQASS